MSIQFYITYHEIKFYYHQDVYKFDQIKKKKKKKNSVFLALYDRVDFFMQDFFVQSNIKRLRLKAPTDPEDCEKITLLVSYDTV